MGEMVRFRSRERTAMFYWTTLAVTGGSLRKDHARFLKFWVVKISRVVLTNAHKFFDDFAPIWCIYKRLGYFLANFGSYYKVIFFTADSNSNFSEGWTLRKNYSISKESWEKLKTGYSSLIQQENALWKIYMSWTLESEEKIQTIFTIGVISKVPSDTRSIASPKNFPSWFSFKETIVLGSLKD